MSGVPSDVPDLMAALEESVNAAKQHRTPAPRECNDCGADDLTDAEYITTACGEVLCVDCDLERQIVRQDDDDYRRKMG